MAWCPDSCKCSESMKQKEQILSLYRKGRTIEADAKRDEYQNKCEFNYWNCSTRIEKLNKNLRAKRMQQSKVATEWEKFFGEAYAMTERSGIAWQH